ncbi:MAG TPA: tetratricopeptide repeat protein, partial [Candidatus Angelobacter sp.]|nr:tetratricopeptide repeat protein [Candidatus Angelobacter sp.]
MGIGKTIPAIVIACLAAHAAAQLPATHRTHPSAAAAERAADDLKDAEELLQKQQYQPAEEKLLAVTAAHPQNPQAWFDLGFAQSHLGKTAESITAYKKAADISPKWFEAQQNLGLALAKSGDFSSAASALRTAVTLKPTTGGQTALSTAWVSLAQVLEESKSPDSVAAYQKAAELDPTNAEAQLGMARMNENADPAAAEQQYLKLAGQGSNESIERLIGFYLKHKRYGDAETWLRKYISANPGNSAAQLQLGKMLAAEGKTQEAIAALEPVYKTTSDPSTGRELASLYLDAKQYEAAAAILQGLVAKNPADAQLHFDYGSALVHEHKYPEAQTELLKAVQQDPKLVDAYF